jgi:hypothetical protein
MVLEGGLPSRSPSKIGEVPTIVKGTSIILVPPVKYLDAMVNLGAGKSVIW